MSRNEKLAKKAHERREQFLALHGVSRLREIQLLHAMWTARDYEHLGFDSFKDFMTAPVPSGGLDISRSWAVQLVLTYQRYIVELKLPEQTLIDISPRKLYFLKSQVTPANTREILTRARTLTLPQLVLEAKGVDTAGCTHPHTETLVHCVDCSAWLKPSPQSNR
jgi:hypothetical protein